MEYLSDWEAKIPRLDILDDYSSELRYLRRVKGSLCQFSFGDYTVKSLVGSIDPTLEKFEGDDGLYQEDEYNDCCSEPKVRRSRRRQREQECTLI